VAPCIFELASFALPGREAEDMNVVLVDGVSVVVSGELEFELELVTLYGHIAHRAVSPDAWASPHSPWRTVRQRPGLDHFADFLA
jgi:hypothetical protein